MISDSKEDTTSAVLLCWAGVEDFVPEIKFLNPVGIVIKMPRTLYKCHSIIACNCMGLRSIPGFPTLERQGV